MKSVKEVTTNKTYDYNICYSCTLWEPVSYYWRV